MHGMPSLKRSLIDKSNSTILAVTSVASFVIIFCIVASISLVSQFGYQSRVLNSENTAVNNLKTDLQASKSLEASYNAFISSPTNIIGGTSNGTGQNDGNNAKIILDALPSTYDYPALATYLQNLLLSQGVQIQSISGTDDPLSQPPSTSSNPTPQPMIFDVQVNGSYAAIQNVVNAFQNSIRPMQIQTIDLSGDQSQMSLTLTGQTYWQPAQNLNISTRVVQ